MQRRSSLVFLGAAALAVVATSCHRGDSVRSDRTIARRQAVTSVARPDPVSAPASASPHATTAPRLSDRVVAYASGSFPGSSPSFAVDDDYAKAWRSSIVPWPASPVWLAYDLSRVPEEQRRRVIVHWYHDHGYAHFDSKAFPQLAYHLPRDYQLQVHAAPGGGPPPPADDPGWTTVATVTGNTLLSRQHVLALDAGGVLHPWLRLRCTAPFGTMYKQQLAIGMDVYDAGPASEVVADDWLFFGDSITAMAINQYVAPRVGEASGTLGQLVHAATPSRFPLVQGAGIGGITSSQAVPVVAEHVRAFPGRFVVLGYGTNDAPDCDEACADRYVANMTTMASAVAAAGKVPVIPTIPWARHHLYRDGIARLNERLPALYAAHPEIVRGPDLWTVFHDDPTLLSKDALHPNERGFEAMRAAWAATMLFAP